ncbi:Cof-type HAD-IIB family hydrolase [Polaribacter haliotis]|uniref:Cof-type HAD-IIB family hydrolase n=1 Tax=Polaribacter haliotis TaxID=1888915 RepID=A0A7L8AEK8_9FLAO|nr:Cof-type HAD-IIB family hydrolase [Polaribacter haliotis]QOD60374.1 Cof-type HAD-IIB family hydrolase [Polaribacter haliotis]
MNLEKIKLVVSDMDGTLLNSNNEVSPLFFELFQKLKEKKIHFCAASGRQYNSIVDKLAPIKDEIYVIAENGAIAKKGDEVLLLNSLDSDKIIDIIPTLRKIDGANMVLCSQDSAYIESKDARFINLFQEYYYSYQVVDDLIEVAKTTPVLKIAVYHFNSSEDFIYPEIKHLKNDYLLKVSGQNWLDISTGKANKGNALREVQKMVNVTKEETMVFGDYHNDIEMLQEAEFSFAMENAHKDIKEIANYETKSNNDLGVERVLEELVQIKK